MSLVGLEPQPQRYPQPSWNVPAHPNGIPHPLHRPPSPGKQQGAFQQTRNHVTRQDSDHCAINIPGRNGRTSCVTYESVNVAFNSAKQRMNLAGPKGRSMTDIDVDHLGQLLVETSRSLATE
ncbi:putative Chorion peroxidase [Daphnia magna]|nr:putative Chorion peroxidase [Daphnia magna]